MCDFTFPFFLGHCDSFRNLWGLRWFGDFSLSLSGSLDCTVEFHMSFSQGEESTETLGPFAWAPKAIEMVTFGQTQGLACASFADIEIWVKVAGAWSKLIRFLGTPLKPKRSKHLVRVLEQYSICRFKWTKTPRYSYLLVALEQIHQAEWTFAAGHQPKFLAIFGAAGQRVHGLEFGNLNCINRLILSFFVLQKPERTARECTLVTWSSKESGIIKAVPGNWPLCSMTTIIQWRPSPGFLLVRCWLQVMRRNSSCGALPPVPLAFGVFPFLHVSHEFSILDWLKVKNNNSCKSGLDLPPWFLSAKHVTYAFSIFQSSDRETWFSFCFPNMKVHRCCQPTKK